jgi:23S rRNA pseudouridine2605 synthase
MNRPGSDTAGPRARKVGIARVLSKAGVCSRTEAAALVQAGRISVNRKTVRDPEHPVDAVRDEVRLDGRPLAPSARVYLMLNKPRGLVTTARDEQGRDTVYRCLDGASLPWVAPVGRLDRASEGLLLFSNDPEWAARIADPISGPDKCYHVQVNVIPDHDLLCRIERGITLDGALLRARSARLLRAGGRNAWIEIVLDEGRNRQIRRLLAAHGVEVLRLVRVAIGSLTLGNLAKGCWRALEPAEVEMLDALRATGAEPLPG